MDKKINNNGFDYVDLDLPSGILWATCNVGADKPSDAGLYFKWGDTQGYAKDQVGIGKGKKEFYLYDYKWYESGNIDEDNIVFKKYTTKGATLDLEDDAAHVNMGGSWHMPSPAQIKELIDNTTSTWTILDNVIGMKFTSKKNASKYIFIPAAGKAWGGSIYSSHYYGFIGSSMLSTKYVDIVPYLYFNPESACLNYDYRYRGLSIRGVIG